MAWFPVDPLDVDAAWLSNVLGAEVHECRLEQIGIGVGVLGRIYRAHLTGSPGTPESVIVKLPTLDQRARVALAEDLKLYLTEVRVYQKLGAQNAIPLPRAYFAAVDECTHDFILVLEDLGRLRMVDQNSGCAPADAATVMDSIAEQHAYWWASQRLEELPWLKRSAEAPFPGVLIRNLRTAWPRFMDYLGDELPPDVRAFGEGLPALIPWYLEELSRPPRTFLHGDLRLDQLFFGIEPNDPPLQAVDWQVASRGRGAYDVGYFMSQSLTTECRRSCEAALKERYRMRLSERGIDYAVDDLERDYRLTVAWCFYYPVIVAGAIDIANNRQLELARTMLRGAVSAIEDNDALALRPD